ncbi:MAG: PDZ domain-containing protein [Pirellula sp.]
MQDKDYPFVTYRTRRFCKPLLWYCIAFFVFLAQTRQIAIGQPAVQPAGQSIMQSEKTDLSISRFIAPKESSPPVKEEVVREWIRMLSDSSYSKRELASYLLSENQAVSVPIALEELRTQSGESLDRLLSFLGKVVADPISPMSSQAFEELKQLSKRTDGSRSAQISKAFKSIRMEYGLKTWERIRTLCPNSRSEFISRSSRKTVPNPLDISPKFQGTAKDLVGLDQVDWIEFARLEGPKIDREILKATLKLPQLKHLQIVNASLTADDLKLLKDGPDLDTLELTYIPVDDEFVSIVQQLPIWGSLWIFGSKLSSAGADELARTLNDVKVDVLRGAYLGVISQGNALVVHEVEPNSAADIHGIRPRDRIVSVNNIRLESFDHLRRELGKFTPGEEVTIEVDRLVQSFAPLDDVPGRELKDLESLLPKRQTLKIKVVLGKRLG